MFEATFATWATRYAKTLAVSVCRTTLNRRAGCCFEGLGRRLFRHELHVPLVDARHEDAEEHGQTDKNAVQLASHLGYC